MRSKYFLYFIIFLTFCGGLKEIKAQNRPTQYERLPGLIPYRKGDLWGYADCTGKIKIPTKFLDAEPFRFGVAVISTSEGKGLIDSLDNVVIEPVYGEVQIINKELAKVRDGSRLQDEYKHERIYNFKEKRFLKFTYHSVDYILYPDQKSPVIMVVNHGPYARSYHQQTHYSWGLYKPDGTQILPIKDWRINYLRDGLFEARFPDERCLVVNSDGVEILPLQLNRANYLYKEGLLVKCSGGLCGYIDKDANEIIPQKFHSAGPFDHGLASVSLDGKVGVINKQGEFVIKPTYSSISPFAPETGLFIATKGKKWGLIDKQGNPVTKFKYEQIRYFNDRIYYFDGKKESFKAVYQPNAINPIKRLDYHPKGEFHEGLIKASKSSSDFGFMDSTGQVVIPGDYMEVKDFYKGMSAVKRRDSLDFSTGKWGVIDKRNRPILPFVFHNLTVLDSNLFCVALASFGRSIALYGAIDSSGKEVIPVKYTSFKVYQNGYAAVTQNQTTSIINYLEPDKFIPIVLPDGYKVWDEYLNWSNKLVRIWNEETRMFGYVDWKGKVYFTDFK